MFINICICFTHFIISQSLLHFFLKGIRNYLIRNLKKYLSRSDSILINSTFHLITTIHLIHSLCFFKITINWMQSGKVKHSALFRVKIVYYYIKYYKIKINAFIKILRIGVLTKTGNCSRLKSTLLSTESSYNFVYWIESS